METVQEESHIREFPNGIEVKRKVALLDHRWTPRIDYAPFARGTPPDTIWSRMYKFRSLVAHGGQPDFTRGPVAVLINAATALNLIEETTKAVVRQALEEPQLIVDLREC